MKDKPDICVRGGNGPNAGHTVIHGGVQYSLRLIPSGFVNPSTRLLIGPGVPVDPTVLLEELRKTDSKGESRLTIHAPSVKRATKNKNQQQANQPRKVAL